MDNTKFFTTKNVVYLAVLTTLLVVLNLLGTVFKIVTNINLTLIPIVLGALTLGVKGGFILGFISGLLTFIFGVTGLDPFTNFLFTEHPVLTFLICTVKVSLGAVLGALVYKVLKNKNKHFATFVASAVVPIINTLIFILGALLMSETISVFSSAEGVSVIYFLIVICAGINFLIELGINMLVAPAIYTVIQVVDKQLI